MARNCTAAKRRKREASLRLKLVLLLQPVSGRGTQPVTGAVTVREPGYDENAE